MLVALVVFGLVMAGLAQTFRFGLVAWSAGPARTVGPENLAALDAALTRMVAQTLPGTMTGRADRLAFTTRLPAGAGLQGGLADAAIMAAPDGTLILRYRPHPPGIPLAPPTAPGIEVLAPSVAGFSVSYLVPHGRGPAVWSHAWKGAGLPFLIRFHIDFADRRDWPDLVVAPVDAG
jgi:general secretion pathway protein J